MEDNSEVLYVNFNEMLSKFVKSFRQILKKNEELYGNLGEPVRILNETCSHNASIRCIQIFIHPGHDKSPLFVN